jgi:hypothetical protein
LWSPTKTRDAAKIKITAIPYSNDMTLAPFLKLVGNLVCREGWTREQIFALQAMPMHRPDFSSMSR